MSDTQGETLVALYGAARVGADMLRLYVPADELAAAKCSHSDSVEAVRKHFAEQLAAVTAERDALAAWKESAISVSIPSQEIGHALGVGLGKTIHDKILPGILALVAEKERLAVQRNYFSGQNAILTRERDALRDALAMTI